MFLLKNNSKRWTRKMWIGVEANTGKRLLVRNTNNGKNINFHRLNTMFVWIQSLTLLLTLMILFEIRKWIGEDTNHGQKRLLVRNTNNGKIAIQFSSAKYYVCLDSEFDFVIHFNDFIWNKKVDWWGTPTTAKYQFSSAKYYVCLDSEFDFVTHFNDFIWNKKVDWWGHQPRTKTIGVGGFD